MEAPVSIIQRAFCTPNKNVGMMNCLFASFVGAESPPVTGGWLSCAFVAGEGGPRVLVELPECVRFEPLVLPFELLVVAHRLAISVGTPTSSSMS